MIEGVVNAALEAVVTLPLQGPAGQALEIDAVVAAVTAKLGCQNQLYQLCGPPGKEPVIWNAPTDGWEMLYVVERQYL